MTKMTAGLLCFGTILLPIYESVRRANDIYEERTSWMARTIDEESMVTISFCGGTVGGKSEVAHLWSKQKVSKIRFVR